MLIQNTRFFPKALFNIFFNHRQFTTITSGLHKSALISHTLVELKEYLRSTGFVSLNTKSNHLTPVIYFARVKQ